MSMLRVAFPEWIVQMCESPMGMSGAIAALNYKLAHCDTVAANHTYQSYASRLADWNKTVPDAPSTNSLHAIVPLS